MIGRLISVDYEGDYVTSVSFEFPTTSSESLRHLVVTTAERIGQGSFGTVYRAKSNHPQYENFALKIASGKPARLHQEQQVMRRVCTKGRVQVARLDFAALNDSETLLALGMELCLPLTLHDFLVSYRLTSEADMLYLGHQVVQAVAAVHDEDCVHRDVKLQNFVFDLDCNVKLIDFGLAYSSLTPPAGDLVAGTVSFMSPEMASNALSKQNRLSVGAAADVWSVGIVLFSIVTQRNPYPSLVKGDADVPDKPEDSQSLLRRVAKGQWQWPAGAAAPSPDVRELIESILVLSSAKRPTLRAILQSRVWALRKRSPPRALQSFLGLEGFESLIAPSPEHQQHLLRNVDRKSHIVTQSRANSVAAASESAVDLSAAAPTAVTMAGGTDHAGSGKEESELDSSAAHRIQQGAGRTLEEEFQRSALDENRRKALPPGGSSVSVGRRKRSSRSKSLMLDEEAPNERGDEKDTAVSLTASGAAVDDPQPRLRAHDTAAQSTGQLIAGEIVSLRKARSTSRSAAPSASRKSPALVAAIAAADEGNTAAELAGARTDAPRPVFEGKTRPKRQPVVTVASPRPAEKAVVVGSTADLRKSMDDLRLAETAARAILQKSMMTYLLASQGYYQIRIAEDQARVDYAWMEEQQRLHVDHPHKFALATHCKGRYKYGIVCDWCQWDFVPDGDKLRYFHCACGMDVCTNCISAYKAKCRCSSCSEEFSNTIDLRRHKCSSGKTSNTTKRPRNEGKAASPEPAAKKHRVDASQATQSSPPTALSRLKAHPAAAADKAAPKKANTKTTVRSNSVPVAQPAAAKAAGKGSAKAQPATVAASAAAAAAAPVSDKMPHVPADALAAAKGPWKPNFSRLSGSAKVKPPSSEERSMVLSNEWIRCFHFYPVHRPDGNEADAFIYHIQPGRTGAIFVSNRCAVHSMVIAPTERSLLKVTSIDPSPAALDRASVITTTEGKADFQRETRILEAAHSEDASLMRQRRAPGTMSVYQAPAGSVRTHNLPFLYIRWFRMDHANSLAAFLLSTGGVQVFVGQDCELRWRERSRMFSVRANGVVEAVDPSSFKWMHAIERLMYESIDE